jgi:hypothetical protein
MSLYVTASEFKQAPTGIDTNTLDQTNIGNQQAQDAALLNILRRASSWVDTFVQQESLEATLNTEIKEVNMSRDGRINVHVDQVPIIQLQSVQFRVHPRTPYQQVDLQNVETRDNWFTIYDLYFNSNLSQDMLPIGFGAGFYTTDIYAGYTSPYAKKTDMPITVKYSYLNGWANTTLAMSAKAGDSTITVADATGILADQRLTIYDGFSQESIYVTDVNGNVLTLKNPLLFGHQVGVGVSAIPEQVKQATIMLACSLIKDRGSLAITMQETSIMNVNPTPNKTDEVSVAKELLAPYRRVVVS